MRKIFLIISTILFICFSGYGAPSVNIRNSVLAEVKKYPELEMQDLYKLAYQAAMGNEHIMADTAQALKFLEEELASIDSSSVEPLLEILRSDSAIARINLRTFKAQNGSSINLFSLMMKTTSEFKPSISMLKIFLRNIEILAVEGKLPFKKEQVISYFKEMESNKFPAVHHSKTIQNKYHPSYRVIAGKKIIIK